ncbi:MAG TPA: archaellin/type IV pilin N-terminal domain-containing protein [Candidatus Nanoarchaeia archaeon]|nr:archaellin/type IV pilin N-terminal domain-containing protein [Candidatus Nanoarchaeia archaeon]
MNKKGLSPVIATVLLIAIALILAVIIFIWARSFLTEQNQKFGEPIERACKDISFDAEAFHGVDEDYVDVVNRGNIPIYGLEIRLRDEGVIASVGTFQGTSNVIRNGESGRVQLSSDERIPTGKRLRITPIILGEKGTERTPYACDSEFARDATVQEA